MPEGTAQQRYQNLAIHREPFLRRARRVAELTIPSLLPPEGHTQTLSLPEPYQGMGARAVLNLANRLMMAILPPGTKSFKLDIPSDVLARMGQESVDPDTEKALTMVEGVIQAEMEAAGWRQPTNLSLQHLIVTGNALEQMLPDNTIRVYRLDQYVVVRSPNGKVLEIVIEEHLIPDSLPENLRAMLGENGGAGRNTIPLYTWIRWDEDSQVWNIHQELEDQKVPGSEGEFQISPFKALRWSAVVGEDYGRGKGEEHIGDLKALDGLSKAILEGAAMASRNITMIRPNAAGGLNLRRRLAKANNGDMVVGNPEDVAMLQFQNVAGMQFTAQELANIRQEFAAAFLLGSGMRRDAERVTAFELRQIAEELEGTLGGVYSMLSQEMAAWRLERLMLQMQMQNKLPQLPAGLVRPTVLTGLEALGREQDVNRVATALQFLANLPPEVLDYLKWNGLLVKAMNGLQLPDVVRTDQEVQEIREQRALLEARAAAALAAAQSQQQGEAA